jgi:hypothetical protein
VRKHIVDFAHDGVCSLKRGRVRQLDLQEGVALVLFWYEAGWKASAHSHSDHGDACQQQQCEDPPANKKMTPAYITPSNSFENAIEPVKEFAERTFGLLPVTEQKR